MAGVLYLLSLVAIVLVVVWSIKNDKIAEDEPTTGLLAMKKHDPKKPVE